MTKFQDVLERYQQRNISPVYQTPTWAIFVLPSDTSDRVTVKVYRESGNSILTDGITIPGPALQLVINALRERSY